MNLRVKLVPWGASYGLRVKKKDVDRLGLVPGKEFDIIVPDFTEPKDLSDWPVFDLGGDLSLHHDDGFEEL